MMSMASKRSFELELLFQALADRTRLRLLNLMGETELCVCYLVQVLHTPQPKISRHLAYLRRAGIVRARREGKWMHYRIVTPAHSGAATILRQTLDALRNEPAMQADRVRLEKACCSPRRPRALLDAPLPNPIEAEPCEVCG